MGATMYPMCSFQTPNVLHSYALSGLLKVTPMGTPSIPILDSYVLSLNGQHLNL